MNIQINPAETLKEFQDRFSTIFPFLRIKFFNHPHLAGQGSFSTEEIPATKTFEESGKLLATDSVEISGTMTVKELEGMFQEKFGMGAQVMRKSGNAWIMTTRTDDWTLRRENETGREDS